MIRMLRIFRIIGLFRRRSIWSMLLVGGLVWWWLRRRGEEEERQWGSPGGDHVSFPGGGAQGSAPSQFTRMYPPTEPSSAARPPEGAGMWSPTSPVGQAPAAEERAPEASLSADAPILATTDLTGQPTQQMTETAWAPAEAPTRTITTEPPSAPGSPSLEDAITLQSSNLAEIDGTLEPGAAHVPATGAETSAPTTGDGTREPGAAQATGDSEIVDSWSPTMETAAPGEGNFETGMATEALAGLEGRDGGMEPETVVPIEPVEAISPLAPATEVLTPVDETLEPGAIHIPGAAAETVTGPAGGDGAAESTTRSGDGATAAQGDNLEEVEGIGPKIAAILQAAGISTFDQLAGAEATQIEEILRTEHIRGANPETWPEQARLLAAGDLEAFNELKNQLKGGRLA